MNKQKEEKEKQTPKHRRPEEKPKKETEKVAEAQKEKIKKETPEKPVEKKETEEKPVKEEKSKEEKKKKVIKIKKTEAFVNETSIPISTKHSIAICKFIKGKKIEDAINNLEQVVLKKKAVPMKGEIPHRKGMMSGRYPKKAAEHFIKVLKRLAANAIVNGLENPVIAETIANFGSRPYGKFGRVRKKRTHLKITVKEKKEEKKLRKN